MKWEQLTVEPERVLHRIRPGMSIFLGTGVAEPRTFVHALMASRSGHLEDLELIQLVSFGRVLSLKSLRKRNYRLKTFYSGWGAAEDTFAGQVDVIPSRFSRIPQLFDSGRISIDVAVVQITPPDADGNCSLGVAVDVARKAMEQAALSVGEISSLIPRTYGETFVHISDFDLLIRSTQPPFYFGRWSEDPLSERLAAQIAPMIPDGSCLSFSIGPLFEALGRHLVGKRHLGVHTPFFTDALMDLVKAGVITNRNKAVFRGKSLASYAIGSPDLMSWLDRNLRVEFRGIETVFNPAAIGRNPRYAAVIPARKIDLSGRVVLPRGKGNIGTGPAEVLDFLSGAEISEGGQTIFPLPSRDRSGDANIRVSVERFYSRFGVQGSVDTVITEFGAAHLRGRTIRERAQALIDIAHPDDRAALVRSAKEHRLLYEDQIFIAESGHLYPREIDLTRRFTGGVDVRFRPIKPSDEEDMRRLFYRFSDEAVYARYFSSIRSMPHTRMQEYVNIDWSQIMSIVGLVEQPGRGHIVAEARYLKEPSRPYAEVAFVVDEAYQNLGISTFLYELLVKLAKERGIRGFTAEVLFSNIGMMKVFRKGSLPVLATLKDGIYDLSIPFDPHPLSEREQSVPERKHENPDLSERG